jgi:hypothetical protein
MTGRKRTDLAVEASSRNRHRYLRDKSYGSAKLNKVRIRLSEINYRGEVEIK